MSLARHTGAHHIFLTSVAAIVAAAPSTSFADPDAQAVLLKAVDAIGLAQSLQFTSTMESEIPFGGSSLKQSGKSEITMKRDINAGLRWRARHEGSSKASMVPAVSGVSDATVEFEVVDRNASVLWIDHEQKKVIEKFARSARSSQVQMANTTWMSNLKLADPFEQELAATDSKVIGQETVGGVKCDVVFIDYGENKDKRRWYFGAEDHLPRKKETLSAAAGDAKVVETITITNLKLNPEIPETVFNIPTPEGYAEDIIPPIVDRASNDQNVLGGAGDGNEQEGPVQPRGVNTFPPPAFDLMDLNGKQVALDQMQNQTIVLYFFASWNPTAKEATAAVQDIANKYKDQPVKVIGMAVRERNEENLRKFLAANNITFPVVYLENDGLFKAYRGKSYPHFAVVGSNNQVIHTAEGFRADETIPTILEKVEMSVKGEIPDDVQLPRPALSPDAFDLRGR